MDVKDYFVNLDAQIRNNNMTKDYTIDISHDVIGAAVKDFYKYGKAENIRVFSSLFEEDEIPTKYFFRRPKHMNELEKEAIQLAHGHILDVGAGCGCHSLALQRYSAMTKTLKPNHLSMCKYHKHNFSLKAIDISPLCVEIMRLRGIKDAQLFNFFDTELEGKYDTILMLMNGIGIVESIANLPFFFKRIDQLLAANGTVYFDSSDLRYLYEEEDGSFIVDINAKYYGEIDFQMKYKNIESNIFNWLYVDFDTLNFYAQEHGFTATKVMDGEHYDYLAMLQRTKETNKN